MKRTILCCLIACLLCAAHALAEPPVPQGLPLIYGIEFVQNQKYPVYSGPGEEYLRPGNSKASVSTKDWIQVLGADGGYLMIRYETSPDRHRIGYVTQDAILNPDKLAYLDWDWRQAHLPSHAMVCENPFDPVAEVTVVTEETSVYLLRDLGEWVYVETADGVLLRAFARSQDVVLDPVPYEQTDAFVQAVRFLREIGVDAQVTGMKGNSLYFRLADGGSARYWHYGGEYAPYEMNWRFTGASDADIEKYLNANLRLLSDVESGRAGEAYLQPDSEHGARNIQAVVSNGLGYLENLGEQALNILRRQLASYDGHDALNSLRSRLELRIRSAKAERVGFEAPSTPHTHKKQISFSCGPIQIIGYCRNDKTYDDPWSTPSHIYKEPNSTSEIILDIWGGQGEWFTLLERCGDWLKVRKYDCVGYISADSISVFAIEETDQAVLSEGRYTVGIDAAAGFYAYSGEDRALTVQSPLYEGGEIHYDALPMRNELYLPSGCTVTLSVGETLAYIHPDVFTDAIREADMLLGSGRIFVPGHMDISGHPYTITLLDASSSILEFDLLGREMKSSLPGSGCQIGEAYQITIDEGRFIEYENCLIERALPSG